jgi:hypothetical protein
MIISCLCFGHGTALHAAGSISATEDVSPNNGKVGID